MKKSTKLVSGLVAISALVYFGDFKDRFFKDSKKSVEPSLTPEKPLSFAQKLEASYKELKVEDLKVGAGAVAARGSLVQVHYISRLPDGKVFDSSIERRTPLEFPLGEARVIPGWDRGIEGMKVGGKRKVIAPPFLAYGERGIASIVPPNSAVEFEFELLKVSEKPVELKKPVKSKNPVKSKELLKAKKT